MVMTLKTEFRCEFTHTDAVNLFVREFMVSVGEQNIPGTAL